MRFIKKKTYFMKTYNLACFLSILFILSFGLTLLVGFLQKDLINVNTGFLFTSQLIILAKVTMSVLQITNILIPCIVFALLLPEFIKRITDDTIINLVKSTTGTIYVRRLLKQYSQIPLSNSTNHALSANDVITKFNKSVKKSVLDLSNEELKLFIKVPKNAQSQKILKEHEEQIKEHILSFYPEYIISTFERNKFSLWLIGTKRR
ncbi:MULTISPECIES: hypothetical protein [Bacillus cereus group]|uniref:hypothetical protein n=1 Tax=Bacillus cereus group TaxID=86661 RepID=UPI000BF7D936|nr:MULTISPECIES: hypothetical protein [Bacillus cereus group]PFR16714.1 hypothetical protein COK23_24660 [Bacillus cereus]PGL47823.1 hypothetical protein CN922_21935 [Bacillus cereus]PHB08661.1 hypothetical protein COE84_25390 [Bacillus wiedmannii]